MEHQDLSPIRNFRLFLGASSYEVHLGRNGEGYFYEIEDLGTLAMVDANDGLSRSGLLEAVGCALEPWQFREFEQLVFSLG